jgi:isoleucyl-tRNA synthetase
LYDFDPHRHATVPAPRSVDAWMQHRVAEWVESVRAAYERYEFHQVFRLLYEFCNVEISATYAKAIKDRLYCELPESAKRRASQSVGFGTLLHLIELSAPVLAFTAEEAWQAVRQLPGCARFDASVHLRTFTAPARDSKPNMSHWQVLMPLVERGNKQLDDLKRTIGLGNPLDAEAVIIVPSVSDDVTALIGEYGPELEDALGVGHHRIEHGAVWDIKINDTRNLYPSCARSWKRRPDVGSDKEFPDLSARDAKVVRALKEKK